MSQKKAKAPPPAPTAGEDYASWVKEYAQYSPERRASELSDIYTAMEVAGVQIPAELELAAKYGPQYNQQAIDLEKQFAPQYNELAQQQRMNEVAQAAELTPLLRGMEDPVQAAIRAELGRQIQGDLSAGSGLTPDMLREIEQAVRGGQQARGMTQGNSAVTAEAFGKGRAGQELATSRRNAAQQFLQTQAQTQTDPLQFVTGRQQTKLATPFAAQLPQMAGVSALTPQAMQINNAGTLQNQLLRYNTDTFNKMNRFDYTDLLPNK